MFCLGLFPILRLAASSLRPGRPHARCVEGLLALSLCLAVGGGPAWAGWDSAEGRLLADGHPVAVRGLWYPLDARRDGEPLEAAGLVSECRASGVNLLGLRVAEGPGLDDAAAVLGAAESAGLAVAVEPRPGRGEAARRIAARLAGSPALQVWCAADPLTAPAGCLAFAITGRGAEATEPALYRAPALFVPGQSFGQWAAPQRAWAEAGFPLLAELEAAPPAWLVSDRLLQDDAPLPDLYRDAEARPQTAARWAGEYLLVPEPAQVRLQCYAALGQGARGVIWDHAGHFAAGPGVRSGAARAAEMSRLYTELGWFEPFLSSGRLLPPLVAPSGVGAGVWQQGDEYLVLLWRDRRLDSRAVGGPGLEPVVLDVPVDLPDGARALRLTPSAWLDEPADRRDGQVRLALPDFDLTAAVLLTPRHDPARVAAVEAALPATARRSLVLSSLRWQQVSETVQALERQGVSAGGRGAMAVAAELLEEARLALQHGYLRSSIERSWQAEGAVREAQAVELEAALQQRLSAPRAEELRLTFPSLRGLREPRERPPIGPFPVARDRPLRLDFEAGGVSSRWTALAGFDQTVATLAVVDGALEWRPEPGDPGALYLPFEPQEAVEVSLQVAAASLQRERLLGLAGGVYEPPVGTVQWLADGMVQGPDGRAYRPVGPWCQVVWRVAGGRVVVTADGLPLGEETVADPVGAVVLAVVPGLESEGVRLDDLVVRP